MQIFTNHSKLLKFRVFFKSASTIELLGKSGILVW